MKWIIEVIVAVTVGAVVVATAQAIDEPLGKLLVDVNHPHPGWTRVVEFDLNNGKEDECPSPWRRTEVDGVYMCQSTSDDPGCYSVVFPTNGTEYTKIHGMMRGYQKGTPDAFKPFKHNKFTINDAYVDGVSITLATSRTHVWTYAAGASSSASHYTSCCNCPCSPVQGPNSPPFVGKNYFCASGNLMSTQSRTFYYMDNPLWDGTVCMDPDDTCCDYFGLPWFTREFCTPQREDIEVRICSDEHYSDEAVLIDKLALYVQ